MRFRLLPLRFHYVVRDSLRFPQAAANLLRGVLGAGLQLIDPQAYAEVFAPSEPKGPSGLINRPRPFVLRAEHLNGRTIAPGETFYFGVHLFNTDYVQSIREALGRLHGAELKTVSGDEVVLSLEPSPEVATRARVEFLTPTELKTDGGLAEAPEFAVLATRIRDRLSALKQFYGDGALPIDFRAFGERAAAVRMTECNVRPAAAASRTSRATGQTHPLGGFVGEACYEGDLTEFLPYLRAAEWTGVGRQTSWGKGEIRVVDYF